MMTTKADGEVHGVAVSSLAIVAAGLDEKIRFYDRNSSPLFSISSAHSHLIRSVAIYHDGSGKPTCLLTGSWDHLVKVWEVEQTGKLKCCFSNHKNRIRCVKTANQRNDVRSSDLSKTAVQAVAISGDDDGVIKKWDLNTGEDILSIQAHSRFVVCLDIHCVRECTADDLFASGSSDRTARLWKMSGEPVHTFNSQGGEVTAVSFVRSHRLQFSLPSSSTSLDNNHRDSASSALTVIQHIYLAMGTKSGSVYVFDCESMTQLHEMKGHFSPIAGLCTFPGTQKDRHTTQGQGHGQGQQPMNIDDSDSSSSTLSLSVNNEVLISIGLDGFILSWDLETGTMKQKTDARTAAEDVMAADAAAAVAASPERFRFGQSRGVLSSRNLTASLLKQPSGLRGNVDGNGASRRGSLHSDEGSVSGPHSHKGKTISSGDTSKTSSPARGSRLGAKTMSVGAHDESKVVPTKVLTHDKEHHALAREDEDDKDNEESKEEEGQEVEEDWSSSSLFACSSWSADDYPDVAEINANSPLKRSLSSKSSSSTSFTSGAAWRRGSILVVGGCGGFLAMYPRSLIVDGIMPTDSYSTSPDASSELSPLISGNLVPITMPAAPAPIGSEGGSDREGAARKNSKLPMKLPPRIIIKDKTGYSRRKSKKQDGNDGSSQQDQEQHPKRAVKPIPVVTGKFAMASGQANSSGSSGNNNRIVQTLQRHGDLVRNINMPDHSTRAKQLAPIHKGASSLVSSENTKAFAALASTSSSTSSAATAAAAATVTDPTPVMIFSRSHPHKSTGSSKPSELPTNTLSTLSAASSDEIDIIGSPGMQKGDHTGTESLSISTDSDYWAKAASNASCWVLPSGPQQTPCSPTSEVVIRSPLRSGGLPLSPLKALHEEYDNSDEVDVGGISGRALPLPLGSARSSPYKSHFSAQASVSVGEGTDDSTVASNWSVSWDGGKKSAAVSGIVRSRAPLKDSTSISVASLDRSATILKDQLRVSQIYPPPDPLKFAPGSGTGLNSGSAAAAAVLPHRNSLLPTLKSNPLMPSETAQGNLNSSPPKILRSLALAKNLT